MNALEILQRVYRESGGPGAAPSGITGLQGFERDCQDWVDTSWRWVQALRQDWWWKWVETTESLLPDQLQYDPVTDWSITDARDFALDQIVMWDPAIGDSDKLYLEVITAKQWRSRYTLGAQSTGRPSQCALLEDGKIGIGPNPALAYSLTVPYYLQTTVFTTNADIPGIPEEYHDILVFKALSQWAMREEKIVRYQYFEGQVKYWENLLMQDPRIGSGYSLKPRHIG